ncbi:MAG: NADH-quinone oxidoreductase subunit M [Anaerolineales bacterium]
MDFIANHLLTFILFLPALGALVMLFLPSEPKGLHRWMALITSLLTLALALVLWMRFDRGVAGFQFEEQYAWYQAIHASFHVGVDGLGLTMVLLTALLSPLALLASFSIQEKVKAYMMLFLFLETGMLGVFMALDMLIFFVFYEVGLVPMFFLIEQWGSPKGERELWGGMKVPSRVYASFKFMVYTMGASLGLLLAIQLMGVSVGSYDLPKLLKLWPILQRTSTVPLGIPFATAKAIAFWAMTIAFALKVPVWPFHTWLPDAHTEAPTAGSMILAGVLLKMGAYGFLRFVLPLYPAESKQYAGWLAFLAVMAIIFGAFGAYGQDDFKRLVAYSSINHMGFVVLGIAAAAKAVGTLDATIALNGAVLQMFNHGLSAAGMFFLVGVIYERAHTRDLNEFGGLFPLLPVYGGILIFTSMASLGLPGLNGFVSEFLVVRGSWPIFTVYTAVAMLGLLFTGSYILKGIKKVLHGPLNEKWAGHLTEINARELLVITPLMVLMLQLGVWPAWLLEVINRAMSMLFGA